MRARPVGRPRGARPRAAGLLQGQDRQHHRRLHAGRRLRHQRRARSRATSASTSPAIRTSSCRTSRAPARSRRCAISTRRCRATAPRLSAFNPGPGDAIDRAAGNGQGRLPQPRLGRRRRRRLPDLLRLRAGRREDLGRHDEPQGVHPRLDRERRRQLHQRRGAAAGVQRAGAPDPRLPRQRRAAHRDRARRARRRLRLLCLDSDRLGQREEGASVRALLRNSAARRSRRARSISAPSPRPTSSARC